MNINLEKVDKITLSKYEEFKNQVQECLSRYEKTDKEKIDLVKEKLKRDYQKLSPKTKELMKSRYQNIMKEVFLEE